MERGMDGRVGRCDDGVLREWDGIVSLDDMRHYSEAKVLIMIINITYR
jgi:hypothetical protein